MDIITHPRVAALTLVAVAIVALLALVVPGALAAPPLKQLLYAHDRSTVTGPAAPIATTGGTVVGPDGTGRALAARGRVPISPVRPVSTTPAWIIAALMAVVLVVGVVALAAFGRKGAAGAAAPVTSIGPPASDESRAGESEESRRWAA